MDEPSKSQSVRGRFGEPRSDTRHHKRSRSRSRGRKRHVCEEADAEPDQKPRKTTDTPTSQPPPSLLTQTSDELELLIRRMLALTIRRFGGHAVDDGGASATTTHDPIPMQCNRSTPNVPEDHSSNDLARVVLSQAVQFVLRRYASARSKKPRGRCEHQEPATNEHVQPPPLDERTTAKPPRFVSVPTPAFPSTPSLPREPARPPHSPYRIGRPATPPLSLMSQRTRRLPETNILIASLDDIQRQLRHVDSSVHRILVLVARVGDQHKHQTVDLRTELVAQGAALQRAVVRAQTGVARLQKDIWQHKGPES